LYYDERAANLLFRCTLRDGLEEKDVMSFVPQPLKTGVNWYAKDMADPSTWTVDLTSADLAELQTALRVAKASGKDLTAVSRDDFPLYFLADKLEKIETELINGRGFVRLRKLEVDKFSKDELTLMYWGIGTHLGVPWAQNQYGELIADVTDRGTNEWNPNQREDERGGVAFAHHTDGADIVGLMCLATAHSGGISRLANTVAIYNDLCKYRPELLSTLHESFPYDFRGGQPEGGKPFYTCPVFTVFHGRLFVRFIKEYIVTSQRHPEAPRLTPIAQQAIDFLSVLAADAMYNVNMTFEPGDIQFINNYHILHGRTAYVDAPELGVKRHLKRLWLASDRLGERPKHFRRGSTRHWERSHLTRQQKITVAVVDGL
jgi:hypothetical protein